MSISHNPAGQLQMLETSQYLSSKCNTRQIVSFFDFSGNWSKPYRDAGYEVVQVDLKHGKDIRWFDYISSPVYGLLGAPDCNCFAGSGAQYWPDKDADGRTLHGLSLVDAFLRAVAIYKPTFWALENPVGRLRRWLGPPPFNFQPLRLRRSLHQENLPVGRIQPSSVAARRTGAHLLTGKLDSEARRKIRENQRTAKHNADGICSGVFRGQPMNHEQAIKWRYSDRYFARTDGTEQWWKQFQVERKHSNKYFSESRQLREQGLLPGNFIPVYPPREIELSDFRVCQHCHLAIKRLRDPWGYASYQGTEYGWHHILASREDCDGIYHLRCADGWEEAEPMHKEAT